VVLDHARLLVLGAPLRQVFVMSIVSILVAVGCASVRVEQDS
jgi:hypothetical protein